MAAFRFFQLSIGMLFSLAVPLEAQFPEDWMGVWKGMMHIYKSGKLVDSVAVTHIIRPDQNPNAYVWRTEYHSTTAPVVKDYKLIAKDRTDGAYVVDEGEGLELSARLLGGKLYSMFEVGGAMLTANYELRDDELIFEVTSAHKGSATEGGAGRGWRHADRVGKAFSLVIHPPVA